MDYFFVFSIYDDYRQDIFNKYISPRNREYCDKHNFKYIEILKEHKLNKFRGNYTWCKYSIIKSLLDNNILENNSYIINMDSDQVIVNQNLDFRTTKSFSYSIDSCNSHCNSLLSFRINDWTKKFINEILSDEKWNRLKDEKSLHEGFVGKYDSFGKEFREQFLMYKLFGIKRHSNISFWQLPNNGWHSNITQDCIYSLGDLCEHVEIWPSCYNVTGFEGEYEPLFFMNKCRKEDVITRHFAGGQDWRLVHNWI